MKLRNLFNYLGLQLGWLACAVGAARGMPWLGPLVVGGYLAVHLRWSPRREAGFILLVGGLGLVVDSLKKGSGLLSYAAPWPPVGWLAPIWIVAMWLLFASAFNASLGWLQGRYGLAALLGAIFGPLSYIAGQRLEAVSFNYSQTLTVIVLALVWGGVTPLVAWLAQYAPPKANTWDDHNNHRAGFRTPG